MRTVSAFTAYWKPLVFILSAAALTAIAITPYRIGPFIDDAPFFFRYAESLASGHGYRFNPDEAPVWGASAPLWPLALAGFVAAGATVETGAVVLGYLLTIAASAMFTITALRLAGPWAATWTLVFLVTDSLYVGSSLMGMESALGFAILGAGCLALTARTPGVWVGMAAGLALVHKLDFAAFGVAMLGGLWAQERRFPWRSAAIAGLIATAWYGVAWVHFGSPLPNSFMTKITNANPRLDAGWFVERGLLEGGRIVLFVLAVPGVWALRRARGIVGTCMGATCVIAAAYTLRPPTEQFIWYLAPVQPAMALLAGCGAAGVMGWLTRGHDVRTRAGAVLSVYAVGVASVLLWRLAAREGSDFRAYLAGHEIDRRAAGRWIEANTPVEAVVFTGYGNIAYYSRRKVIDYSGLNRAARGRLSSDLVRETRPDLMVHCASGTGIEPEKVFVPAGFRLVAFFDRARRAGQGDFYVFVLARDGVAVAEGAPDASWDGDKRP